MKKKNKEKKEYLMIIFLVVFAVMITLHSSVVNPLSGDNSNDSWVFRYMGMLIAKGGMPYRDAFDQKGPLLYFIEYLGYILQREYGIWILEVLSMTLLLVFTYALCRKLLSIIFSAICCIVSVGSLSLFFSGNMSEEFALPFIAGSIYIFSDYFLFGKYNHVRIILCGFCLGCVLMLRPNMIALWIVMSLAVIINEVKNNKIFPVKFSLLFIVGICMSVLPFIIWLYLNDAFDDFIMQYLLHNATYTSGPYSIIGHIKLVLAFANGSLLIIPIVFLLIIGFGYKQYKFYNITFVCFIIINVFLCSISVRGFYHYGMPLVVSHAYPLALFTKILYDAYNNKGKNIYKYIIYLLIITYSFPFILFISNNIVSFVNAQINYQPSRYDVIVIEEIKELTDPDDRILVLGHGSRIYYESDRLCSAKYFIQEPIYNNNNTVLSDIKECLNSNLPKLVIYNYTESDGVCNSFFEHMDEYELVDSFTKLYLRN